MNGNAVIRSHVWRLDLSQTLQGAGLPAMAQRATAGGVGGRPSSSLQSPASSLSCGYDANGNITDWVTPAGQVANHQTYDLFGNILSGEWINHMQEVTNDTVARQAKSLCAGIGWDGTIDGVSLNPPIHETVFVKNSFPWSWGADRRPRFPDPVDCGTGTSAGGQK